MRSQLKRRNRVTVRPERYSDKSFTTQETRRTLVRTLAAKYGLRAALQHRPRERGEVRISRFIQASLGIALTVLVG
jgi:hypothetical protein